MAYEYGVNLKLNTDEAQKSIEKVLKQLEQVEKAAGSIDVKLDTKGVSKQLSGLSGMSNSLTSGTIFSNTPKATKVLNNIGSLFTKTGTFMSKVSEIGRDVSIGMRNFQSTVSGIMGGVIGEVQSIGTRFLSLAEDYFSQALEQYQTMEQATVGFGNLFTDDDAEHISETIVKTANRMAGVSVNTMLRGVNVLAPYTEGSSDLAIGAASGLMKAMTYSGQSVTENGLKALTNLGQLASGQFRGIADIRELYRQVPAIDKLLQSTTKGVELLDKKTGKLSTDQMRAFIKKYGSQAFLEVFQEIGESSAASDIYEKYGKMFSGSLQNLKDNIVAAMTTAFDDSGLAGTLTKEFVAAIEEGGFVEKLKNKLASIMSGINDFVSKNMDKLKAIGKGVLTFLQNVGIAIGEAITELAKYLGILNDDGEINLEGIKKLADDVSKFVKGIIQGFKDGLKGLGDIIKWISEHLGTDGWEKLGQVIGWILSPLGKLTTGLISLGAGIAKVLAELLITTGKGLQGGLVSKLFGGGATSSGAGSLWSAAGLFSMAGKNGTKIRTYNTQVTDALSSYALSSPIAASNTLKSAKSAVTKNLVSGLASKAFKGLAIAAVGEVVTDFASDFIGNVTGSSSAKQTAKELGDVATTGLAVGAAFNPIAGLVTAFGKSIIDCTNVINETRETEKKYANTLREQARGETRNKFIFSMLEQLKKEGIYSPYEEFSEDAFETLKEVADSISIEEYQSDPQGVMNKLYRTYLERRATTSAGSEIETWIGKKIEGTTSLSEKDLPMLQSVARKLSSLGIISNPDEENLGEDWKSWEGFLKNQKFDFNTTETLDSFSQMLNTAEEKYNEWNNHSADIKLYYDDGENVTEFGSITENDAWSQWFEKNGFTLQDGKWVTNAEIQAKVVEADSNKSAASKTHDVAVESQKNGNNLEAFSLYLLEGVQRIFMPWEWGRANGGFVKPIYRAGGGGLDKGIDTVPAMLSPGEFVMKRSAVSKAGLGVMEALNRGDFGYAARSLGARFSNSWDNSRSYTRTVNNNQRTITNNIGIVNRSVGGALNSSYSLANRMAASF